MAHPPFVQTRPTTGLGKLVSEAESEQVFCSRRRSLALSGVRRNAPVLESQVKSIQTPAAPFPGPLSSALFGPLPQACL